MRIVLAFCLLFLFNPANATDVFVSTDPYGRKQFSDTRPETEHQQIDLEIQNEYDWHDPGEFIYTPPRPTKRRQSRPAKHYTLDELKRRCHEARGKYNNFRGTDLNIDWDTYRARLAKYKAKRDEWCSRLASGR